MTAGNDPVRWLCNRDPLSAHPSDSLRETAEQLSAEHVGALVVLRAERLVGVVSERDIVRALAEGADPDAERVSDVMSVDVVVAEASEPLSAVAALMVDNEVRHAVVVDGDTVAGVVSIRDVLAALLRETRSELSLP